MSKVLLWEASVSQVPVCSHSRERGEEMALYLAHSLKSVGRKSSRAGADPASCPAGHFAAINPPFSGAFSLLPELPTLFHCKE